jgi:broad specificity phosphatase PhoE
MLRRRKKKTVHVIRHAESEHNTPPYSASLRDPYLTPAGQAQAETLGRQFPNIEDIDLIVCSPMKRAISTGLLAFKDYLQTNNRELVALPELQELSGRPCDIGSSLAELLTEFREEPVDLSRVPRDWESKDKQWSPTEVRTLARMAKARAWLRDRPESNILVISHSHCMQLLVRDAPDEYDNDGLEEIRLGLLPVWRNCEWRSFVVEKDHRKVLLFEETKSSKKAKSRGENVPRLGETNSSRKGGHTSNTSNESSNERPKSRWSSRRSRATSNAESSPTTSVKKSTTWPKRKTSLQEPQKVGISTSH